MEQTGVLYFRASKRGRKLRFVMGGPTLQWCIDNLQWHRVDTNIVYEWHGMDGTAVTLLRP